MRSFAMCNQGLDIGFHVPEHVRHNEESHVAATNVDLIKMRDTAVASGDGNILELNVHVVLGYNKNHISIEPRKKDTPRSCSLNCISISRPDTRKLEQKRVTHLPKASPGTRRRM